MFFDESTRSVGAKLSPVTTEIYKSNAITVCLNTSIHAARPIGARTNAFVRASQRWWPSRFASHNQVAFATQLAASVERPHDEDRVARLRANTRRRKSSRVEDRNDATMRNNHEQKQQHRSQFILFFFWSKFIANQKRQRRSQLRSETG